MLFWGMLFDIFMKKIKAWYEFAFIMSEVSQDITVLLWLFQNSLDANNIFFLKYNHNFFFSQHRFGKEFSCNEI